MQTSFTILCGTLCLAMASYAFGQTHGTAGAGPANTGNSQSSASPNVSNNAVTGQPGSSSVPMPTGTATTGVSAQPPMINGQPVLPPALQNAPGITGPQVASPNTPPNSVTGQPGSQSVPMPAANSLQNQPNQSGATGTSPANSNRLTSPNMAPNSATGRPGAQSVPMPGSNSLQTQPNSPKPFRSGTSPFGAGATPTGAPAAQSGSTPTPAANSTNANLGGEQDIPPPADDAARNRVDANRNARQDLRDNRQDARQDLRQDRQAARADANDWRFSNYNGEWWYWMPDNYWMYYRDNKWSRYDADSYQPGRYTTAYRGRGENGIYYDESGRQYRRDYAPLRSALRNAQENGAQIDINAGPAHVETGPGGVQVGAPGVQVGTPPANNR